MLFFCGLAKINQSALGVVYFYTQTWFSMKIRIRVMSIIRIPLYLCLLLLVGCASLVHKNKYPPEPEALARALSGELVLGRAVVLSELPEENLFGLTEPMKVFAQAINARASSASKKAELLHQQLILPQTAGGRGISYSALRTITGVEAFEQRQANCLSYTLLYVSLARYLGLKAYVNEVMLPPTWGMRNDETYLFMRHVNAMVNMPKPIFGGIIRDMSVADISDIVVDLEMRRYRANYTQGVISEASTAGMFYSNKGMELAAAGNSALAFKYLRRSLQVAEEVSYLWSNLGSFYRKQGLNVEAEAAYLQGLGYNPKDLTIMHNLAGLYLDTNNPVRAEEFRLQVRRHRNANPYFIYRRAQEKLARADLPAATALIEQAIKKQNDEPLFYKFALKLYEQQGDTHKAEKMRQKIDSFAAVNIL
jgi:tetratricopeptide (TPR) repeat protein